MVRGVNLWFLRGSAGSRTKHLLDLAGCARLDMNFFSPSKPEDCLDIFVAILALGFQDVSESAVVQQCPLAPRSKGLESRK